MFSSNTRTTALGHHSALWRVLEQQQRCPFHLQKVQTAENYPRLSASCRWYINQTAVDSHFAVSVSVTDEATFTQDVIFNCHNMHMRKQEKPVRAH
jgi:hypothetical protein